MSDEADLAQEHIEREEVLRKKYNRKPVMEADVTGECLNCYEPVGLGMRWCDKYCQEDWQKRR
jgi:hypothetical protein